MYVLFRATTYADGRQVDGYVVAGQPLARRVPTLDECLPNPPAPGLDRLSVSLLVIHEVLDQAGMIRECTLERRRGAVDGPYYGEPARVEFIGAARAVRQYRALQTGRLVEILTGPEARAEGRYPLDPIRSDFSGDNEALRAHFGVLPLVLDQREPTLFEEMAGLSAIAHVRLPDGREIGCGIGWHGTAAYVLTADFPRFGQPPALPPEEDKAVEALLRAHGLVRYELRIDQDGLGVMARRPARKELFIIRSGPDGAKLVRYHPGQATTGSPDQQRWLRYIEKHEGRTILDSYLDGPTTDLVVLTADAGGEVCRHHVDEDGVETWRRPDNGAAVAVLHREVLFPDLPDPANSGERADTNLPPVGSLLAKTQAFAAAVDALRAAREASGQAEELPDAVTRAALEPLRALSRPLEQLAARFAAAATGLLLRRAETEHIDPVAFLRALDDIEARLLDEMASIQVAIMAPGIGLAADGAPFGADVETQFPSANYHIEEAVRCLALRRPTAAVLHGMKIMQCGLTALMRRLGVGEPEEQRWSRLMAALRPVCGNYPAIIEALEKVRRGWRSPGLMPADKYTEEEASTLLHDIASFMQALAAVTDEGGDPIGSEGV